MKRFRFFIFDFDNTAAGTFEPNIDGIDVPVAYRIATDVIFGKPLGEELYDAVGGLKNRSPSQLIEAMLSVGDKTMLLCTAKKNIDCLNGELDHYVPVGKGRSLHWNGNDVATIAEALVRLKLQVLMKEIGTTVGSGLWPRPMPGFCRLWEKILNFDHSKRSNLRFVPVILSSGHDLFIIKCFKQWDLPPPKHMVTDDTMRMNVYDSYRPDQKAKPNTLPISVFASAFGREEGLGIEQGLDPFNPLSLLLGRTLVAGDCSKADGGLATNIGAPFIWFNQCGQASDHPLPKQTVQVKQHWLTEFGDKLFSDEALAMMDKGEPMFEVVRRVFVC